MKPSRIYKAGRPTTGFRRGEKITDPAEVHVGDKLIALSHRFKAENLYRVTAHKGDRLTVIYVQPNVSFRQACKTLGRPGGRDFGW